MQFVHFTVLGFSLALCMQLGVPAWDPEPDFPDQKADWLFLQSVSSESFLSGPVSLSTI